MYLTDKSIFSLSSFLPSITLLPHFLSHLRVTIPAVCKPQWHQRYPIHHRILFPTDRADRPQHDLRWGANFQRVGYFPPCTLHLSTQGNLHLVDQYGFFIPIIITDTYVVIVVKYCTLGSIGTGPSIMN